MKKIIYSLFIITLFTIIIFNIFYNPGNLNSTISLSINLFLNNVFPSLFPMFIISSMLISIGIPEFLGNIFNKLFYKLFKVKGTGSFIFILSMITGFPSSAKYINDLIDNNELTVYEGEKLLLFTFFSNPLFLINTVGILFFNNIKYGYLLLISQVLGNILVGLLFRNFNKSNKSNKSKNINFIKSLKTLNNNINNTNALDIVYKSIFSSLKVMINIYGIITIFLIIISCFNLNSNNLLSIILIGLTEITTGLKYLSVSSFSINIKLMLSCVFICFGGFSIHAQIFNILNKKKIRYSYFLLSRVLHLIISTIILFILLSIFQ